MTPGSRSGGKRFQDSGKPGAHFFQGQHIAEIGPKVLGNIGGSVDPGLPKIEVIPNARNRSKATSCTIARFSHNACGIGEPADERR